MRPYEEGDIKYFWASEKHSGNETDPEDFAERLKATLFSYYDVGFTMEALTPKGRLPVGAVFGKYVGPFLWLGATKWLGWASERNKIESAVNLLNELRKDGLVMLYSNMADKDFYTHISKHGVIRRVGTIHDLIEDEPVALFQTRKG